MRYLATIFILCISYGAFCQIPEGAYKIVDSILTTHQLSDHIHFELDDSIFYDYNDDDSKTFREKEIYFFSYKVKLRDDLQDDLNIAIYKDLSIEYVSGIPDIHYKHSPNNILPRKELWKIARKNGFKCPYRLTRYHLTYFEDKTIIYFHKRLSKWDINHCSLNAHSGEYLGAAKMNATF